jgi:biofilm PGA synthesis N-glycosyltransferase PgaC
MILTLAAGFFSLKRLTVPKEIKFHSISVVIPVRNETDNIQTLLSSLAKIRYPNWEVIFVDDNSTDGSFDSIHSNGHPFPVKKLSTQRPGKKSAITTAIQNSTSDIIVTTDADCRHTSSWLEKINAACQDPNVRMMIGGVRIEEDGTVFSQLQSLEFVSVAATGAATIGLGFPTMCSGANLSYRRDAFLQVDGYKGSESVSSGDDEYLMNKFSKTWSNGVGFLFSGDSLVTTLPSKSVKEFNSQRLRWAGKWRSNISLSTQIFALVVWLFHVIYIVMAFSAVFGFITWKLFIILAGVKIFVEAAFLVPAAKFFRVKWRWISFLVLQFVYSFYVITTGFMSQISSPKWKGRTVAAKV